MGTHLVWVTASHHILLLCTVLGDHLPAESLDSVTFLHAAHFKGVYSFTLLPGNCLLGSPLDRRHKLCSPASPLVAISSNKAFCLLFDSFFRQSGSQHLGGAINTGVLVLLPWPQPYNDHVFSWPLSELYASLSYSLGKGTGQRKLSNNLSSVYHHLLVYKLSSKVLMRHKLMVWRGCGPHPGEVSVSSSSETVLVQEGGTAGPAYKLCTQWHQLSCLKSAMIYTKENDKCYKSGFL